MLHSGCPLVVPNDCTCPWLDYIYPIRGDAHGSRKLVVEGTKPFQFSDGETSCDSEQTTMPASYQDLGISPHMDQISQAWKCGLHVQVNWIDHAVTWPGTLSCGPGSLLSVI